MKRNSDWPPEAQDEIQDQCRKRNAKYTDWVKQRINFLIAFSKMESMFHLGLGRDTDYATPIKPI